MLEELTSAVLMLCAPTPKDRIIAPVIQVTMVTDKTVKVDVLRTFDSLLFFLSIFAVHASPCRNGATSWHSSSACTEEDL